MKKYTIHGLFWLASGIGIFLFVSQYKNFLIDDSYITLTYVKNLLSNQTWGMLRGSISNSATSPLNVILLSVVALFTGANETAAITLTAILLLLITYQLCNLSTQLFSTRLYGFIASAFIIFNPLLLSTIGLESILFTFLFILALSAYTHKNFVLLGAALGLLTTTRAEGGLFYIVFFFLIKNKPNRHQLTRYFILSATPWYLFSWIYLGSAVPDTLFIKMGQGSWGYWSFANGAALYFSKYPLEMSIALSALILLPTIFFRNIYRKTIVKVILICFSAHFSAYCILHVPPYHWYYTIEIVCIILLGVFGLGFYLSGAGENSFVISHKTRQSTLCLAIALPVIGIGSLFYLKDGALSEPHIHTNWATADQYKTIAKSISAATAEKKAIVVDGEIGTLAYFCENFLLDPFTDRSQLIPQVQKYVEKKSSFLKAFIYINHFFLKVDTGPSTPPYTLTIDPKPSGAGKLLKKWHLSSKWSGLKILKLYKLPRR